MTLWFPSAKSQRKVRDRIHELTDRRTLAHGTLARPPKRWPRPCAACRGYFRHSLAHEAFGEVWHYAFERLCQLVLEEPEKGSNPGEPGSDLGAETPHRGHAQNRPGWGAEAA